MANLIGQTLKQRYEVIESLGRGGMAEVYKVWDSQRGVHLAMKVLREDLAEDRVFLRRFQREAENLAKLQHPNIVRFYGLEQEAHLAFILMEFIEGTTLRRQIFDAGGPIPLDRVLDIMQPVCSALQYAHQMGLLHCDLKSGNIMLDKHGKVYITDFGIARMSDATTATLVGAGTPAYMAPELVRGEDPTPQTDIYALGVVLYEMLTGGERPFIGELATITGTTAEKVRWEQVNLPPTSPSKYNPNITSTMETALIRALEKQANKRFCAPVELYKALEIKSLSNVESSLRSAHSKSAKSLIKNPRGGVDDERLFSPGAMASEGVSIDRIPQGGGANEDYVRKNQEIIDRDGENQKEIDQPHISFFRIQHALGKKILFIISFFALQYALVGAAYLGLPFYFLNPAMLSALFFCSLILDSIGCAALNLIFVNFYTFEDINFDVYLLLWVTFLTVISLFCSYLVKNRIFRLEGNNKKTMSFFALSILYVICFLIILPSIFYEGSIMNIFIFRTNEIILAPLLMTLIFHLLPRQWKEPL